MAATASRALPRRQPRQRSDIRIGESSSQVPFFLQRVVVIGGGIAGVCCAQEVARLDQNCEVIIVSASSVLKESVGVIRITNRLEEFSVYEKTVDIFRLENPRVSIIIGDVESLDIARKLIRIKQQDVPLAYDKLCICSGARPRCIFEHRDVIGLRDLESVEDMADRLTTARRVVIVGNGGIALELVHTLHFCDVQWLVRDSYVGSAFFDASSSEFIMPTLLRRQHSRVASAVGTAAETMPCYSSDEDNEEDVLFLPSISRNRILEGSLEEDVVKGPKTSSAASSKLGQSSVLNPSNLSSASDAFLPAPDRFPCSSPTGPSPGPALGPEWMRKVERFRDRMASGRGKRGALQIHLESYVIAYRAGLLDGHCPNKRRAWNVVPPTPDSITGKETRLQFTAEEIEEVASAAASATAAGSGENYSEFPIYIMTSQAEIIGCDFVVSATGVEVDLAFLGPNPSDEVLPDVGSTSNRFVVDEADGGTLIVDEYMRTSIPDIFAAGDCCSYRNRLLWDYTGFATRLPSSGLFEDAVSADRMEIADSGNHWFQMKLWTQARHMGLYAAQCMSALPVISGSRMSHVATAPATTNPNDLLLCGKIFFEMFTHTTRFFGHKVVLLGRYNAQGITSFAGPTSTNTAAALPEALIKNVVVSADGFVRMSGEGVSTSSQCVPCSRTTASTYYASPVTACAGDESATAQSIIDHVGQIRHTATKRTTKRAKTTVEELTSRIPSPETARLGRRKLQPALVLASAGESAAVQDLEIWVRITPGTEYVKVVVYKGKVVGALLIGETGMEEVFENLIMNRLDVSQLGIDMLDPGIDIEDFFD